MSGTEPGLVVGWNTKIAPVSLLLDFVELEVIIVAAIEASHGGRAWIPLCADADTRA